jgi:hypothetical protein
MLAAALAASVTSARADTVPRLNVEKICSAIAAQSGETRTKESCLRSENETRTSLAQQWNSFPASDRSSCYSMTQMGGVGGTYAELLTCLEMARDVRKLPKESTTTGMGGTTDRRSRPR